MDVTWSLLISLVGILASVLTTARTLFVAKNLSGKKMEFEKLRQILSIRSETPKFMATATEIELEDALNQLLAEQKRLETELITVRAKNSASGEELDRLSKPTEDSLSRPRSDPGR